jgi:iron complex outermembrane receptor protein
MAFFRMDLKQFADNGKTVGALGGAPYVTHLANYHAWDPSASARYRLRSNWSVYGQFSVGSAIPPSSVFDSTAAQVAVLPKPTTVKTYQAGSVLKFDRWTLDFDGYYSHFQNPYTSFFDPASTESYFYQTGPSNTKGFEAESNVILLRGLSLYLNATVGAARYQQTGLWVQNTPSNTQAAGLTYRMKGWDFGFIDKRVGHMWNDNGTQNQAVPIDPFNVANIFANYTVRGDTWLRGTKFRFGVNNLQDNHNIVGVNPASTASNAPAPGDVLILLPARSFFVSLTFGWAPGR